MFKKEISPPPELAYDEQEEVMLEPRSGHSSSEIVRLFEGAGAPPPVEMAPGFLSGVVPTPLRGRLTSIAIVHRKTRKRMH